MEKTIRKKTRKSSFRVERRGMLDAAQKDEMFAVLVRNPNAFELVHDAMTVDKIQEISDAYGVIWKVVRGFYKDYAELPTKSQIHTEVRGLLKQDPGMFTYEDEEEFIDFLDYAFDDEEHGKDLSRSRGHERSAVATAKLFLEEHSTLKYQEQVHHNGRIIADLPAALQAHRDELAVAEQLTTVTSTELFPEGWDEKPGLELRPTGVGAMDRLLSGGLAGGEVLAFMAPFGSCKTTVAVQTVCLAAEKASRGESLIPLKKKQRAVAFLISTEMVIDEFRIRALSFMTKIPRKRLARAIGPEKGIKTLSNSTEPGSTKETHYEKKAFKTQIEHGDGFMSEQQRVRTAIAILERHLFFLDCTEANPDRPPLTGSGIRDIANWVKSIIRKDKTICPSIFVLDHASALALCCLQDAKNGFDDLRQILRDIPRKCGEILAKPYKVGCIVFHQLSGEANSRGPAADIHHTDAAECKAFAEYADHAIMCGRPTENADQVAKWKMTKHRREPPREHALVKIVGHVCKVVDVSATFATTADNRAIVRKTDLNRIESGTGRTNSHGNTLEGMG